MIAMYRYTKHEILFLDVVEKRSVTKAVRNFTNTTVKAKINQSKSTGQLGDYCIVRPCVNAYKETVVKHQSIGHSKCIEKYYDSIVDTCHANPFAVLQTSDSDSVDSDKSVSTVVEDACNTDCHSGGTVNIDNGRHGRYKGKQIAGINTANCRQVVSDSNVNVQSNCHIHPKPPNKSQNETVDSKTSTLRDWGTKAG